MGRKIEKAVELREKGIRVRIISESHWLRALSEPPVKAVDDPAKLGLEGDEGNIAITISLTELGSVRGEADQPSQMEKPEPVLAGMSIAVTGMVEGFNRKEIEVLIVRLGGKLSSTVNKKTSFVLAGESPGSKVEKAKQLGVPVLSKSEFLEKVGVPR